MDSNKLGMKIRDWAANLGFTLPDGSAPPASHFALLTATPHRRQLWEALIESVQPRQKIEHMRKQILVAKFQEKKKYSTTSSLKHITDRFDLWQKQNALEADIKEKTNVIIKLEKNIMTKASDSVFEICKLSELEKLLEEFSEKSVVLKLLIRQKKKIMDIFEKRLVKIKEDLGSAGGVDKFAVKENYLETSLLSTEECKDVLDDHNHCKLLHKIDDLCKSGMAEQFLWEEIMKNKGILLDKFSAFLEALNSSIKTVLREKESELEKKLNLSITKLKQKTTEKSLQTIINSTNWKLLDAGLEELERSLFEDLVKMPQDGSLNETISFLSSDETSKEENEKWLENFKSYLNVKELESYREFLKDELARLEEETVKAKRVESGGDEGVQNTLKAFESAVEEINSLKSEGEEIEREIFDRCGKLQTLLDLFKAETETKAKTRSVEEAAEQLKSGSLKEVDLILETPSDVFRTVETSGRISFECESASHYLNNYGGESKQLFSAMLIPPAGDLRQILREVEKRKQILKELNRIASERDKLSGAQRNIQRQVGCISCDTRFCDRNFKDSDGILWNVESKTDQLHQEVVFVEKILNNWVEQPYRLMIKGTSWGKGLKESEERYKKGKTE